MQDRRCLAKATISGVSRRTLRRWCAGGADMQTGWQTTTAALSNYLMSAFRRTSLMFCHVRRLTRDTPKVKKSSRATHGRMRATFCSSRTGVLYALARQLSLARTHQVLKCLLLNADHGPCMSAVLQVMLTAAAASKLDHSSKASSLTRLGPTSACFQKSCSASGMKSSTNTLAAL